MTSTLTPIPQSAVETSASLPPQDLHPLQWTQALLRFNLDPATYADPSWLPAWAADASPDVRRALSSALLQEWGLDALFDWTLNERASRLFLMDREARQRIGLVIGIAAYRDSLRQVVLKHRLSALRRCFGDAWSTLWTTVADTVPHAQKNIEFHWGDTLDGDALKQRVTRMGEFQLLRLLDESDPAQRASAWRAAFCLPRRRGASHPMRWPALTGQRAARMSDAILDEVIPRWAPEWTWLF